MPKQSIANVKPHPDSIQLAPMRAKNAKTFAKYLRAQQGYGVLSLDSRRGFEHIGVVDLVAVKPEKQVRFLNGIK